MVDYFEYLKIEFDDYLGEDGTVKILDYEYERDEVLKAVDRDTYELAFKDWCDARRDTLNELYKKNIKIDENEPRLRKLKEAYKKNKVIPFVGAGLSIPSDYPGWTNFLFTLQKKSQIAESEFEDMLSKGLYEEAAELVYEDLGEGIFYELFDNRFDVENELRGCVQLVPQIFDGLMITTNYDTVIERSFSQYSTSHLEKVCGNEVEEIKRYLATGESLLIKLHGTSIRAKNRVLTKKEYDKSYLEDNSIQSLFEALSHQTLLFMGCSLNNDRPFKVMQGVVDKYGANKIGKHYALLAISEDLDIDKRTKFLASANIFPIWYSKNTHDESIEAVLRELIECRD